MMSRTHLCALIVTVLVACQRIPQEIHPGVGQGTGPSGGGNSPTAPPTATPPGALDSGLPSAVPPSYDPDGGAQPVPTCSEGLEGSETSCKSEGEWKELVHGICTARGQELTYFGIGGGDCGDGRTRYAKYQCCPPRPVLPPPPPPPVSPPQPAPAPGQPGCAGKSCGESCQACAAGDPTCVQTAALERCNFVGKCVAEPEPTMCSSGSNSCPPGLTWCFFTGRCVDPHCRTCCDSNATPCQTAADCGPSCTTCADGARSCDSATCGERDPGSCFFFEPKCK
jgi:hypothetical protein